MTEPDQDKQFTEFVKRTLDQNVQDLDSDTRTRLSSARHTVLSKSFKPRLSFYPAWGIAAACLALLTFTLWEAQPPTEIATLPLDDVEILASADGWEFYEDLEFYSWLAENDQTG